MDEKEKVSRMKIERPVLDPGEENEHPDRGRAENVVTNRGQGVCHQKKGGSREKGSDVKKVPAREPQTSSPHKGEVHTRAPQRQLKEGAHRRSRTRRRNRQKRKGNRLENPLHEVTTRYEPVFPSSGASRKKKGRNVETRRRT